LWTRGDRKDFDEWARLAGNSRWSYEGLLPYFRKSERHFDPGVDVKQHGLDGPVSLASVSSTGRNYPLRDLFKSALESAGIHEIADANAGSPFGIGEATEARLNDLRLIASEAYSLKGVRVMTETLVHRLLIEDQHGRKVATGVMLADGTMYHAEREVILCAGAYRTPQVLLLSGIGPAAELARLGIEQVVEAPHVGKNLFEHMGTKQLLRLRHPEAGAAAGSPQWTDPAFQKGNALDWVVCHSVPVDGLKAALAADESEVTNEHPLLDEQGCHVEVLLQYITSREANPKIPPDGTHITSLVIALHPTSRGSIALTSVDPTDAPLIDMNCYATQADRYVMREGLRKFAEVIHETAAGQEMIIGEAVPDGLPPLTSSSTDEDIDRRVAQAAL
jgi:choline dehydrogenase-like flavoprotein